MLDHLAPLYITTAGLTGGIIAVWLLLYALAPRRLPQRRRGNQFAISPKLCVERPGNALVSAPATGLFQLSRIASTHPAECSWPSRHIGDALQSLEHTRPILHGRALASYPEAETAEGHFQDFLPLAHSDGGLFLTE